MRFLIQLIKLNNWCVQSIYTLFSTLGTYSLDNSKYNTVLNYILFLTLKNNILQTNET